jgi:large subunit ribosomal protein L13
MHKQNKTFLPEANKLTKRWFILDAAGKTLGRLTSEITKILRGKHKPIFTPHMDCGDGVVVINAEKARVTGSKSKQKLYRHYTGSMGGLREIPYEVMLARHPERIIEHAVCGMMPKTRLARKQCKHLRVVAGAEHGMEAQSPIQVNI